MLSKNEILDRLRFATNEFTSFCTGIETNQFFLQPTDKWSIAQNVTHLIAAARITSLAFRLPKFMVRIYGGKPNRPSRSYDELVAKYKLRLEQGGKASGPYIPKPLPAAASSSALLAHFTNTMKKLMDTIERNSDEKLDKYIIPHPLLGKITLRELGYFTIYHTYHHLNSIKEKHF
jgi:DinB superfamily